MDEIEILNSLKKLSSYLYEQFSESKIQEMAHKFFLYGNVLVMQIDGETKGFCAFYANDAETKTAYLSVIVVARDVQGMGCGAALLTEMMDFCKQKGMERLRLEVSDSNARAIRFYKAHGFALEHHLETSSYFIRTIDTEEKLYAKK